jgi:hypothetical protein
MPLVRKDTVPAEEGGMRVMTRAASEVKTMVGAAGKAMSEQQSNMQSEHECAQQLSQCC